MVFASQRKLGLTRRAACVVAAAGALVAAGTAADAQELDIRLAPAASDVIATDQLRSAIDARLTRLPPQGRPTPIVVVVERPRHDRLRIKTADRSAEVALGAASRDDPTRLAALVAIDLLTEAGQLAEADVRSPDGSARIRGIGISAFYRTGTTSLAPPSPEATVVIEAALAPRLALRGEIGYGIETAAEAGEAVRLHQVPTRLALQAPLWRTRLRVGSVLRPFWVRGSGRASGALVGGFAAVGVPLTQRRRFAAELAAGADLYGQPLEVRVAGRPMIDVPRLSLWMALTLGWSPRA